MLRNLTFVFGQLLLYEMVTPVSGAVGVIKIQKSNYVPKGYTTQLGTTVRNLYYHEIHSFMKIHIAPHTLTIFYYIEYITDCCYIKIYKQSSFSPR